MAIVQISKILHRSGNIDSLPQLDAAEFGLAVDYSSVPGTALNRLFIGPVVPVVSNSAPLANNIEILTQYSTISKIANGNSSASVAANGNITFNSAGNIAVVTITGNGLVTNGLVINNTAPAISNTSNSAIQLLGDGGIALDRGNIYAGGDLWIGGNANIVGNLAVFGNTTYIYVETLIIEDPIIEQGGGPNGAPLTANDGLDRGQLLHYFTTTPIDAFQGWDNSAGEFIFGSNVTELAGTITVNRFGNVHTGNLIYGNGYPGAIGIGELQTGSLGSPVSTRQTFGSDNTGWQHRIAKNVGGIVTDLVSIQDNGNVTSIGNIISDQQLISTIAIGTAPLRVTSTTRVANLYVQGSNESNIQSQATGTFFLNFTPANGGGGVQGNLVHSANTTMYVDLGPGLTGTPPTIYAPRFSGAFAAPGINTQVIFNDAGILGADAGLVFDKTTDTLTVSGNAYAGGNIITTSTTAATSTTTGALQVAGGAGIAGNVYVGANANITGNANVAGNINTIGNIISNNQLISTIAIGTPPLEVTSTTRVANLYVQGSNESNIQSQAAGTFFLNFTPANGAGGVQGNLVHSANTTMYVDLGPGLTGTPPTLYAPRFSGAFVGNFAAPGNTTEVLFNDAGNIGADAGFLFDKTTDNLTVIGNVTSNILISTVAVGTPPLTVTSNTRVVNLAVDNSNTSNIQGTTTGTYFLHFGNTSITANSLHYANANFYANAANGALHATKFVGDGIVDATGANGMNPTTGNIYGSWTLAAGATLQATYADLAEYYASDADYEPGTVLEFGGAHEVTIAEDETQRVAGVVSTSPAYGMNADLKGEHIVALALQGRVPCKVRGTIRKGDMMISAGGGYARPTHSPKMGTVIGKSLEDFSGEGVIEIAVGRL